MKYNFVAISCFQIVISHQGVYISFGGLCKSKAQYKYEQFDWMLLT